MPKRAENQMEAANLFYGGLEQDVSYFASLWHTYKVGQLMTTDLDRAYRRHGISMADIHLLGAVRMNRSKQLRATDLAEVLCVSNAALTSRVAKLERKSLLVRIPSTTDRRAYELKLTAKGTAIVDSAAEDVGKSVFIRCLHRLSAHDQSELARIMTELHHQLERDVVSTSRGHL